MPDHACTDDDSPTTDVMTFEVEMTRVESVTIQLPDGVSVNDLSSKRLYRWPDTVLDAIEAEVREQLLDFHGWQLANNVTEISHEGGSATH